MKKPPEIVRSIADLLKPWANNTSEKEISEAVREAIYLMRDTVPRHFGRDAIRHVRERARKIIKSIDALDRQITNAPIELDSVNAKHFLQELRKGRQIYAAVVDNTLTAAGRKDNVKELCGRMALNLVYRFSAKQPDSGSADSPFRAITSALYEAVTGEADKDFERPCEEAIRKARQIHDAERDAVALWAIEHVAGLVQIVDKKSS